MKKSQRCAVQFGVSAGLTLLLTLVTGTVHGVTWQDYFVSPYTGGSSNGVAIERVPGTSDFGIVSCYWSPLRHSQGSGSSWTTTLVTPTSNGVQPGCLAYHPVTRDPYVAYQIGGVQFLAHFDGTNWISEVVPISGAGGHSTVRFDPVTGEPAIAFGGSASCYAWHDAGGWHVETIHSGFGGFHEPCLRFDPVTGAPCVAYSHTFNGAYFARRIGPGMWDVSEVESLSFPWETVLEFNPVTGQPGVAYALGLAAPVHFAEYDGSSWAVSQVTAEDVKDPVGLAYTPDGVPMVAYTPGISGTSFIIAMMEDGAWSIWSEHYYGQWNWSGAVDLMVDEYGVHVAYQACNIGIHYAFAELALTVQIDIKPGSWPNAINLGSHGLIPVAILSTEEFDAVTVDPDTVELAGSDVAVRGKGDKYMAHEEDVNGDGVIDLVVQLGTENLDPTSLQDGSAALTGTTYDGKAIKGEDDIIVVPAGGDGVLIVPPEE